MQMHKVFKHITDIHNVFQLCDHIFKMFFKNTLLINAYEVEFMSH